MPGAGPGNQQLNAAVAEEFALYVAERARVARWKKSEFVCYVLDWWREMGCPPVALKDNVIYPLPPSAIPLGKFGPVRSHNLNKSNLQQDGAGSGTDSNPAQNPHKDDVP